MKKQNSSKLLYKSEEKVNVKNIAEESNREKSRNCELYGFFSNGCFKVTLMFWTTVHCLF